MCIQLALGGKTCCSTVPHIDICEITNEAAAGGKPNTVTHKINGSPVSSLWVISCSLDGVPSIPPAPPVVSNLLENGELMVELGVIPAIRLVVGGPPGLSERECMRPL